MTLGSTQPPLRQVPEFFSVVKCLGREVHSSPPYTVEVKNECSCTSNPPVCLYGLERESFIEVGKSRSTRTESNTKYSIL